MHKTENKKDYIIYIHFGPWKTGSTYIQEFLHSNRELLQQLGCFYPEGYIYKQAHHEFPNLIENTLERFESKSSREFNNISELHFKEFRESHCGEMLISSEDFSIINLNKWRLFVNDLTKLGFTKIRLVGFNFNPIERLFSYCDQPIRQGEYLRFYNRSGILFNLYKLKIKNYILKLKLSSKNSEVRIQRYRNADDSKQIIAQFCLMLGKSDDFKKYKWQFPPSKVNESLSKEKSRLHNDFNRMNVKGRKFDPDCPIVFSKKYQTERDYLIRFQNILAQSEVKSIRAAINMLGKRNTNMEIVDFLDYLEVEVLKKEN